MNWTRVLAEWAAAGAALILVVVLLRWALGKRVSAGLRYALWGAVLVRLLVPVQLFPIFTPAQPVLEPDPAPIATAAPLPTSDIPPSQPAFGNYEPFPAGAVVDYKAAPAPNPPKTEPVSPARVLGWVWLAGTAGMGLALILSNASFACRLRRARIPMDAGGPLPVYIAPGLPSPCLFGVVRPAVYLTPQAAEDPVTLRHVLAHEATHFRHGDQVWNVLRGAALAVHWWNPLVWLAAALSRRDCELACDEGALKRLGDGERTAYGRTLLALLSAAEQPRARAKSLLTCATTMTGGQKSAWERVTRIARAPKRWLWAAAVMVLVTALAGVCVFGSAREAEESALAPELWLDLSAGDGPDWDSALETQLPEYPGAVFRWTAGSLKAVAEDGQETVLYSGMPIWDVYFADLNGDGKRELCSRTSFGSGMIDDRVQVYDYTNGAFYQLEDRGFHDYTLSLEDGALWAYEWDYMNTRTRQVLDALRAGPLTLREGGGLEIDAQYTGGEYDVAFSITGPDEAPVVHAQGSIGSVKIAQGASWSPVPAYGLDVMGHLTMPFPPVGDEDGIIAAWWTDSTRSAITVTGQPFALTSSAGAYDGWRTYTAAFDGPYSQITESHIHGEDPQNPYLGDLSDEDALYLAWIAARVLYGAEDCWLNQVHDAAVFDTNDLTCLPTESGGIRIQGLEGDPYVEWHGPDDSPSGGWLYFTNPGFCCPSLAGKKVEGSALWTEERTGVSVVMNVDDGRGDHGTIAGFYIHFRVDLASNTVLESAYQSEVEGETLTLSDWEMTDMAWAMNLLLTAAEEFYYASVSVEPLNAERTEFQLAYHDRQTTFTARAPWVDWDQTAGEAAPQVIDIDGDGRREIVVILTTSRGTGALLQELHVFDAESLKEDPSAAGLAQELMDRIVYTRDERYFYLSVPGAMSPVPIPRSTAQRAPAAAIQFGDSVEYRVQGGCLYCLLGCDTGALKYSGTMKVRIGLSHDSPGAGLYGDTFEYVPNVLLPPYEPGESLGERYRTILLGGAAFSCMTVGGYLGEMSVGEVPDYFALSDYSQIDRFALVDLDQDGTEEVVLHVSGFSNDLSGYVALFQEDGWIFGWVFGWDNDLRAFQDLKTDGTFLWQDPLGTEWLSVSSVRLWSGGMSREDLAFAASSNHEEWDTFQVNHQQADREAFEAALAAQDDKPDAVWYEFTPENIQMVFDF